MVRKFVFNSIYSNVVILFINTSITDAFFESIFIPPFLVSIPRLIINMCFIFLTLYYFLTSRIRLKKYGITIAFLLFVGCTLIWTPDKFETLKLYINFLGPCAYFILLFLNVEKEKIIKILYNYAILIIFSDILAVILPNKVGYMGEEGSANVLRGINLSRSAMTVYINFCIFIFLYYFELVKKVNYKEKYKVIALIIVCIFLILLSKSSTGIITIALFIPLLKVVKRKKISKVIVNFTIIIGILLPVINFTSSAVNNIFTKILGRNITLSGRRYIWDYVIEKLTNNPIVGNGFNSTGFFLKEEVIPAYGRVAAHAHNGFLELFLQTGLIGFILLISIIFIIHRFTFTFEKKEANLVRSYIVVVMIFNFMEPYLINNVSVITLWLPVIFIITLNYKKMREA